MLRYTMLHYIIKVGNFGRERARSPSRALRRMKNYQPARSARSVRFARNMRSRSFPHGGLDNEFLKSSYISRENEDGGVNI